MVFPLKSLCRPAVTAVLRDAQSRQTCMSVQLALTKADPRAPRQEVVRLLGRLDPVLSYHCVLPTTRIQSAILFFLPIWATSGLPVAGWPVGPDAQRK